MRPYVELSAYESAPLRELRLYRGSLNRDSTVLETELVFLANFISVLNIPGQYTAGT